ncbi:hypothetical protein [Herbidospora mongoliensis]|uniref:hypothetical protein n=1 Tax=Herbidospora mongoliensis TaxID=688067 RepID=UPI001FDF0BE4|nr:hypothetical protein [Herbidospora mongoliensis]
MQRLELALQFYQNKFFSSSADIAAINFPVALGNQALDSRRNGIFIAGGSET